jgi:DNA-directed RNA polymerase subunit RPC12/RpoP
MDGVEETSQRGIAEESGAELGVDEDGAIQALATIFCSNCGYKKKFRNRFLRENIELIVVSMKILDWMSCERCGQMLSLRLEFDI